MTDEGELEKQIDSEFKKAYDACYSEIFNGCFKDFTGQSQIAGLINTGLKPNIHKKLHEAKKDFPKKKDVKRSDLKATEPVDKATYGELIQGLEALKWFKKWFGDSS